MPKPRSPWLQVALAALCLSTLSACGSGWRKLTREEMAKGSLVYLYIDTDELSGHLDRVVLRQVKAGQAPQYWGFDIHDERYVWFEGLANGKYMLDNYGGTDGFNFLWMRWGGNTHYTYNFPAQGSGFSVDKQGVYFLGAFKHKRIKGKGFFAPDKFDLEPAKAPSAKEIFPVILEKMKKSKSPLLPMAERHARGL